MARKPRRRAKPYIQVYDDQWIEPVKVGFISQCCDCGLVHVTKFAVENGTRVQFKTQVDRRLTAAARRSFHFTKEDDA